MTDKVDRDIQILTKFVDIYCENKHKTEEKAPWVGSEPGDGNHRNGPLLCRDCSDLVDYSAKRRALCPLDPKPTCKNCRIHCYSGGYRDRIREVMRFSGMHLIKRGRLDMIYHYFF